MCESSSLLNELLLYLIHHMDVVFPILLLVNIILGTLFSLLFFLCLWMTVVGCLMRQELVKSRLSIPSLSLVYFFFADWPTCLSMLVGAVSSFWCIIYRMEYTSFRAIILVCSKLVGIQACCFMYVCVCVFLSPSLNVNVG